MYESWELNHVGLMVTKRNDVLKYFQSLGLGVSVDAIRIISYGEERPVDLGQSEDAWSLNRRVEILY